jgi:hypothetical protein
MCCPFEIPEVPGFPTDDQIAALSEAYEASQEGSHERAYIQSHREQLINEFDRYSYLLPYIE